MPREETTCLAHAKFFTLFGCASHQKEEIIEFDGRFIENAVFFRLNHLLGINATNIVGSTVNFTFHYTKHHTPCLIKKNFCWAKFWRIFCVSCCGCAFRFPKKASGDFFRIIRVFIWKILARIGKLPNYKSYQPKKEAVILNGQLLRIFASS